MNEKIVEQIEFKKIERDTTSMKLRVAILLSFSTLLVSHIHFNYQNREGANGMPTIPVAKLKK